MKVVADSNEQVPTRTNAGVSTLMPAWNAEVECCLSEDTRPESYVSRSPWVFSDAAIYGLGGNDNSKSLPAVSPQSVQDNREGTNQCIREFNRVGS